MEEAAAKRWLSDNFDVPRETIDRLEGFVGLLRDEVSRQNLVSKITMENVWNRHIIDSAQLLRFAPDDWRHWLDLGSGAGFPGLVVALLTRMPVTLVEQRRLRAEFLLRAASVLGLDRRITILATRLERVEPRPYDVISARAFAPLERLLQLAAPFSTLSTRWILPKGRNAKSELVAAQSSWQGAFRVEPSLTDDDGLIIVAEAISRKPKGSRSG